MLIWNPGKPTRLGLINQLFYYSSYFLYYLDLDDIKSAEDVLNDINNFVKYKMATNDAVRETTMNNYRISLNLKKEIYDGAEQYYISQFQNIGNMLTKVSSKFELGKIYMHDNKMMEAKESFLYVVDHGNTLYKVQQANEYLKQISSLLTN